MHHCQSQILLLLGLFFQLIAAKLRVGIAVFIATEVIS
jgi:hypothetical protein